MVVKVAHELVCLIEERLGTMNIFPVRERMNNVDNIH